MTDKLGQTLRHYLRAWNVESPVAIGCFLLLPSAAPSLPRQADGLGLGMSTWEMRLQQAPEVPFESLGTGRTMS